jgi:hypothetical protein
VYRSRDLLVHCSVSNCSGGLADAEHRPFKFEDTATQLFLPLRRTRSCAASISLSFLDSERPNLMMVNRTSLSEH